MDEYFERYQINKDGTILSLYRGNKKRLKKYKMTPQLRKDEKYEQLCFVSIDEQFVSELGEALDQYNFEDYPHLVMDVWEDSEYGTVWEIRLDDEPFVYDVSEDDITRFHRFADCHDWYNPRDEVLCYFVLSMKDYAKRKEAEKCKK